METERLATATEQMDRLADRLDAILEQRERNQITVTHTQAGNMGFFGGIAIALCGATIFLMIAFMIIENRSYTHLDNQVDQLRAWIDVHSREIGKLQAEKKKP